MLSFFAYCFNIFPFCQSYCCMCFTLKLKDFYRWAQSSLTLELYWNNDRRQKSFYNDLNELEKLYSNFPSYYTIILSFLLQIYLLRIQVNFSLGHFFYNLISHISYVLHLNIYRSKVLLLTLLVYQISYFL